jgi:hypothetical protein
MTGAFSDLSEHTGTLVVLVGAALTVCGVLIGVVYKVILKVGETLKTDILKMIASLDGKIDAVWGEIGKVRDRQVSLRESLPKEYMRLEGPGYKALIDGLNRIETHFEQFADDCRSGQCGGKKS